MPTGPSYDVPFDKDMEDDGYGIDQALKTFKGKVQLYPVIFVYLVLVIVVAPIVSAGKTVYQRLTNKKST